MTFPIFVGRSAGGSVGIFAGRSAGIYMQNVDTESSFVTFWLPLLVSLLIAVYACHLGSDPCRLWWGRSTHLHTKISQRNKKKTRKQQHARIPSWNGVGSGVSSGAGGHVASGVGTAVGIVGRGVGAAVGIRVGRGVGTFVGILVGRGVGGGVGSVPSHTGRISMRPPPPSAGVLEDT